MAWMLAVLVGAAFVLADVVIVWIGTQADWAFDFTCCYQQAAERAITDASTLYDWSETYTFRYTPIGSLPFVPLVPLSEEGAAWAWLLFKLGILVLTAAWFSSRWTGAHRIGAALLVLAFPPIVHDLVIGNVSTITVLAFLAVARWQDPRGGVALGIITVLMPKPHLVPVLAYLAVRRPRDFAAAAGTIAAGVVIGLVIFGVEPWVEFIGTLREPLERTFTANIGWSGLLGQVGVVIGVCIGLVVLVAAMLVGGSRGLGLSIVAGILAGPYTFIHYLSGTVVAVEPVLRTRPRWLAPFAWLLVVFPLIPVWLTALAGVVARAPEPTILAAPHDDA
jgi:Glycosyltransferase family 87